MNSPKKAIRLELEAAKKDFHKLLKSLSDSDLKKQSNNSGWTNQEILFHITFAYMLIPRLILIIRIFGRLPDKFSKVFAGMLSNFTSIFNWINALGARGGGRFYGRKRIENKFDNVIDSNLKLLDSISNEEMKLGMHYPKRWDNLFDEYMTLEKVFHYPTLHFKFHLKQISH